MVQKSPGFTLVELMIVIGVMGVLASITIPGFYAYLPKYRASGAARQLFTDLQWAKMKAVAENNDYVVTFDTTASGYTIYDDDDNDFSTAGAETGELVRTASVGGQFPGIGFGWVSATNWNGDPITGSVSFTGTPPRVTFRPTGLANKNGSVYLKPSGDTSRPDRQRAVTVLMTGRIRLYKNNGSGWE